MKNKRVMLIILTCVFLIIPLTFAQTPQSPDIDGSGEVDILDVLQVVNDFGLTSGFDPRVDLNNDGVINVLDILMIVSNWGAVPADPPTINSFTASPQTINPGESSTLSWSVTRADLLRIDSKVSEIAISNAINAFPKGLGPKDVTGLTQIGVSPASTTTYKLTAANNAGLNTKEVTVIVQPLPTCARQSGFLCEADQTCKGKTLASSDIRTCCSVACLNPTCTEKGGNICQSNKICPSSLLTVSDTDRCCLDACVIPQWDLCKDCGGGLLDTNLCDKDECNSISQGCYFVDKLIGGYCKICSGSVCGNYADKTTCVQDRCNFRNCNWIGNACVTVVQSNPPTINSFTASPLTINPGESLTLSWSVTGSGSLTLNPGNIDVTGSTKKVLNPIGTITYNLTAANSAGRDSKFLTVVKKGPNPHLKYFGYFGSEFIGGCDGTPCALEVADHSNVIHVYAHLGNFQYLRDTFKLAAENGVQVMVSVAELFWPWQTGIYNQDFQADWDQMAAFLKDYESQIVAFYHMDEPYAYIRNEYDGRVLPDEQDVLDQLKSVNDAIEAYFPDIPRAIVYSQWIKLVEGDPPEFCPSCDFQVPIEFDWIGVDLYVYTTSDSLDDVDGHGHGVQYYYDLLKSKKNENQKMYLVSDGQYFRDYIVVDGDKVEIPLTPELEQRKVDIANWYYNLAKSEPDVIMIQPYLWASYQARYLYRGTRDMDLLKTRYNQIGKEISGK